MHAFRAAGVLAATKSDIHDRNGTRPIASTLAPSRGHHAAVIRGPRHLAAATREHAPSNAAGIEVFGQLPLIAQMVQGSARPPVAPPQQEEWMSESASGSYQPSDIDAGSK
jgi:hypothetical protein